MDKGHVVAPFASCIPFWIVGSRFVKKEGGPPSRAPLCANGTDRTGY